MFKPNWARVELSKTLRVTKSNIGRERLRRLKLSNVLQTQRRVDICAVGMWDPPGEFSGPSYIVRTLNSKFELFK